VPNSVLQDLANPRRRDLLKQQDRGIEREGGIPSKDQRETPAASPEQTVSETHAGTGKTTEKESCTPSQGRP